MKLETIKKDKRKKIIIGSMIVLSVVGCITLTTTRAKYRNVQSLKLASGIVKINSYDFKIVAMKQSEDGTNYTDINTMPESGYIINEEKSYCTTDNKTQAKGKLKTIDGNHVFSKLNKNDKCYIWFDKEPTGSDIIIANIEKSSGYKKTATPDFSQVATGAETEDNNGVYVTDDPMYGTGKKTYYWRGAATTNHVIFDNKCWRIVRINGNKTIRIIYNGIPTENTCPVNGPNSSSVVLSGTAYNSNRNKSSYVGWTYTQNVQRTTSGVASNAKGQTERWYTNNISEVGKAEVDIAGKFCNDRNVGAAPSSSSGYVTTWSESGEQFAYAGIDRLWNKYIPTLSCDVGDTYSLSVGAITADEVMLAGGKSDTNTSYYLYTGQNYWTMSPNSWSNSYARMFIVDVFGNLTSTSVVSSTSYGLRPVVNLRPDVTFKKGSNGTSGNPYIVE